MRTHCCLLLVTDDRTSVLNGMHADTGRGRSLQHVIHAVQLIQNVSLCRNNKLSGLSPEECVAVD